MLSAVLAISLAAKLAGHVPFVAGTPVETIARDVYDYLKDMALVFITLAAAYLASVFQRRATFVASLERQWRDIVRAKGRLITYFEKPYPSTDDWLSAYAELSETIDTMRIIYRNAGETRTLIGLYPYAPLHDMRRVVEAMDPRNRSNIPAAERKLAKDSVLQAFFALRETFLEELDLEDPDHPLLISGGRRLKVSGRTERADARQRRQREAMARSVSPAPEIDAFLGRLYAKEHGAPPAGVTAEPRPQRSVSIEAPPNAVTTSRKDG